MTITDADVRRVIVDATVPYSQMSSLLNHLRKQAQSQVAQYPQYDDALFAKYTEVVVFTRNVTTKMGLAFRAGQLTIMQPDEGGLGHSNQFATCWSFNNAVATSVRIRDFVRVYADSEGYITTKTSRRYPKTCVNCDVPVALDVATANADKLDNIDADPDALVHLTGPSDNFLDDGRAVLCTSCLEGITGGAA